MNPLQDYKRKLNGCEHLKWQSLEDLEISKDSRRKYASNTGASSYRVTDRLRQVNMGTGPSFCETAQLDQDEQMMLSCGIQNGLSADAVITKTLTLLN